jgi:hypothetical protein
VDRAVLDLMLAGDPVRADALGLDLARRLLGAGVVVPT